MLKNYLVTALRHLRRSVGFTFIHITGLAIGISAALVIYLIVHYDLSFDHFEKNRDRIYRVVTSSEFSGEMFPNSGVPFPLPSAVSRSISGVERQAAFYTGDEFKTAVYRSGQGAPAIFIHQLGLAFADRDYFRIWSYQWLAGSSQSALQAPFRTVLTLEVAKAYFPGLSPGQIIGQRIVYDDSIAVTVSGIVKGLDQMTDFTFKQFISYSTITSSGMKGNVGMGEWGSVNSACQFFVVLSPGTRPSAIEKQLAILLNKNDPGSNKNGSHTTLLLQPLSDIHFNEQYGAYDLPVAHKPTLYGLSILALFLLLLGCINFINLTTAQASRRAREIGIRKTMGSSMGQLVVQLMGETCSITLVATLCSVALIPLLLHIFSGFIPSGLRLNLLQQPGILIFLVILFLLVSLSSGIYPALVLSRYQPVQVLKNQSYGGRAVTRSAFLRKVLTVSQFVIAEFLILATLVVARQIHYFLSQDMGFRKQAIVYFNIPFNYWKPDPGRQALATSIRGIPGVRLVSTGGEPPASGGTMSEEMSYTGRKAKISTDVQIKYGDTNYIPLYGLRLLAGRNLRPSDTMKELIINSTYARRLGFQDPTKAIGQMIDANGLKPIVGVIADFHQKSLQEPIKPLAITYASLNHYTINVSLDPEDASGTSWQSALAKMGKAYQRIYPQGEFNYQFVDQSIAAFYTSEQNISKLLKWATALAMLISCLGLLGLVTYTTQTRTKEIGVRKVLGASVPRIVAILSGDLIRGVLLSFVLAAPIAWWVMRGWLDNYAYRTGLSWWLFALSGIALLSMALLTLSIQTIRAALANPVKSLRTE